MLPIEIIPTRPRSPLARVLARPTPMAPRARVPSCTPPGPSIGLRSSPGWPAVYVGDVGDVEALAPLPTDQWLVNAKGYSGYPLTDQQRRNANIILDEFARVGLPTHVALAAVANALAESNLNERAVGDTATSQGGESVGLFQLRRTADNQGAGHGMTVAERQDPRLNTRRIIEEVIRNRANVVDATQNAAEATWAFTVYVERPANARTKADERVRRYLRGLFPEWATTPKGQLPTIAAGPAPAKADSSPLGLATLGMLLLLL